MLNIFQKQRDSHQQQIVSNIMQSSSHDLDVDYYYVDSEASSVTTPPEYDSDDPECLHPVLRSYFEPEVEQFDSSSHELDSQVAQATSDTASKPKRKLRQMNTDEALAEFYGINHNTGSSSSSSSQIVNLPTPAPSAVVQNQSTNKLKRFNSTDAVNDFVNDECTEDTNPSNKRKRQIDNGAGMAAFMSDTDSSSD